MIVIRLASRAAVATFVGKGGGLARGRGADALAATIDRVMTPLRALRIADMPVLRGANPQRGIELAGRAARAVERGDAGYVRRTASKATSPAASVDCEWATPGWEGGAVGDVVYRSEIEVERVRGALRRARLPAEPTAVAFGVHGAVAEHYGAVEGGYEPHATTLDYVVAAAAG